jgi:hypothetical protein
MPFPATGTTAATAAAAPTPGGPSMDPIESSQMIGERVAATRRLSDSSGAFLQLIDRTFLSRYLAQTDDTAQSVGDLNTQSHTPGPQPWYAPQAGNTGVAK